jgi:hypothetical protein
LKSYVPPAISTAIYCTIFIFPKISATVKKSKNIDYYCTVVVDVFRTATRFSYIHVIDVCSVLEEAPLEASGFRDVALDV